MKSIGIVREIDRLGRVVIPIEFRNSLGLDNESPVEITAANDRIIIKKLREKCILCGSEGNLVEFHDSRVCLKCIEELKNPDTYKCVHNCQ